MKFLFVAKSIEDPATRYRVAPIVRRLKNRGDAVTLIYDPGIISQLRLIAVAKAHDLILVQRKLMNCVIVWLLARLAPHIVFDFDDAIFVKSTGKFSRTRSARFRAIVRSSKLVIAGNKYLCDEAAAQGVEAIMIPTSVDLKRYVNVKKSDELILVWIGSNSTARYLRQQNDMLRRIAKIIPNIKLRVIGDFSFDVSGLDVECVSWSEETESMMLASAHIGVAPMSDDEWTRGKCALKIIQYMAAGLPVVASNVGANKEVVINGQTGFLVDTIEDWSVAIQKLSTSERLRLAMGSAGREIVAERYNQNRIAEKVVRLLDSVIAGKINTV